MHQLNRYLSVKYKLLEIASPFACFINCIHVFQFLDIEDINFQNSNTSISCKWFGFEATHTRVNYSVCLLDDSGIEIICEDVRNGTSHTFTGVTLFPYTVIH